MSPVKPFYTKKIRDHISNIEHTIIEIYSNKTGTGFFVKIKPGFSYPYEYKAKFHFKLIDNIHVYCSERDQNTYGYMNMVYYEQAKKLVTRGKYTLLKF